jgi:5-methylcytosine-specific restriction enzyme A
MRICSGAGCLRAVNDEVRFCDECKPIVEVQDDTRAHTLSDRERFRALYSGPRWQKLRVRVIQRCPLCARCELSISEIADHIVPSGVAIAQAQESGKYADLYAGFFFMSNLQGLCRSCHYDKTMEDKTHSGPWPDVVEKERLTPPKRMWSF